MKEGLITKLRWTKRGTPAPEAAFAAVETAFARPPEPLPRTSTGLALELYGLPLVPPEYQTTPRSVARFLLKVAAEIEHGLLVQYLYAKYSIVATPTGANWAGTITDIAVQEMDHLINVQNMLMALKSDSGELETYFDRQNFPIPPDQAGYYPFAFRLEPFTGDSLAKYVSVESPLPETICDLKLRAELVKIIQRAIEATGMNTIGHVGNLYAYLYWLFLPSDNADANGPWEKFPADWFREHVPGQHLTPDDFADPAELDLYQADFAQFQANDGNSPEYPHNDPGQSHRWIFKVKTLADAQRAIAQIAIQGEGTEMADDSHFLEFVSIYDDVEQLPPDSLHLNVPTNPNLDHDPLTEAGRITNTDTQVWARLCNARYLMLLQELPLALALPNDQGDGGKKRSALVSDAIFTEMLTGIKYIATRLMALPRGDDPNEFAGPIFALPDDFLPSTTDGRWKELVRLIRVSEKLLAKIQTLTGPGKPNAMDLKRFQKLAAADKALLQLVPPQFGPPTAPTATGGRTTTVPQLNSFADVKAFFNNFITTNGTDLSGAPHRDFWNTDYNSFVNGSVPHVDGVKILTRGDADHSNLILILRGALTIGGTTYERMPADGSPYMSTDQINALADWINRNCPQ